MPSDRRARRFQDILDNIARIERFTAGLDFEAFTRNEETFYAVLHALLIMSEAARKLQGDAEALAPSNRGRRSEVWEMCFGMLMTVLTPGRLGFRMFEVALLRTHRLSKSGSCRCSVTRYIRETLGTTESDIAGAAERMKMMRAHRRQRDLREPQLVVPDARSEAVPNRIATQLTKLNPDCERDTLRW